MKTKSNFLRMMLILVVVFLGGQLNAFAAKKPWIKYSNSTITFYYSEKESFGTDEYDIYPSSFYPGWVNEHKDDIKKAVFDPSFADARPTICKGWFAFCKNLTSIQGFQYLNTSEVEDMSYMFCNIPSLASVDLSRFNTAKVKNMGNMFTACFAMTSLDLTSFDTHNVTNMFCMFGNCTSIKDIYVSKNFTTDKVTDSEEMFLNCNNLKGNIAYTHSKKDKTHANLDGYFKDKTCKNRPWAKYTDGTLTFQYGYKYSFGENEFDLNSDKNAPGWDPLNPNVTKVVFDQSFAEARPTSCHYWFHGCTQLSNDNIIDINYLNTSNVTYMSYMFSGCSTLKSLNLSNFNTAKVIDMMRLFENCSSLDSLDLSSFNTANVTTAPSMFNGCANLKTVNVSSFNTAKLDNMGHMFANCSNLVSVDLSNFNTTAVKWIDNMFKNCSNLTTIYASDKFALGSGIRNSTDMFIGCEKLVGIKAYDANYVDKTYATVDGGYFTDKLYTRPWVTYADGTLTYNYGYKKTLGNNEYLLNTDKNVPGWEHLNPNVTKVVFEPNFALFRPTSCYYWFHGCNQLSNDNIIGFNYLNTSEVKTFRDMFWNCANFTTLDLSTFNTEKCEDMAGMFNACSGLTSLNLSSFKTDNVKDMIYMFYDCNTIETLDLTNFNTSNVTTMENMFYGCSNLTTICASDNFTTAKVSNSKDMFAGCENLMGDIAYDANYVDKTYAKMDEGYFGDKKYICLWAKYADGTLTFKYCYKKKFNNTEYQINQSNMPNWYGRVHDNITKVVFHKSVRNARPTNCSCWFAFCSNLTDIEGIEYLNTSEVTNMFAMFHECRKLTSLDLSNFDTRKVTNINSMFNFCDNLKYIYVGDKFANAPKGNDFVLSSSVFYCNPEKYNTTKANPIFAECTVKPYVNINAKAEYGTICVPLGSSLAEGSFSGFDKLYTIKSADKDKGTITMEEATTIEPGVAYVYRRNLPEGDTESIITFDADNSATATEPMTYGSLLKGTFSRITAPGGCYILQSDGNFHPVAADNTTLGVGAYKAYLDLSSLGTESEQAKNFRMVFEDKQATGIKGISDQADLKPMVYFDLMGRRVATPRIGGIYIVNGKKVIYKN